MEERETLLLPAKAGEPAAGYRAQPHSIEIEQALTAHAAVLEVAVVAQPDEKWGEVPVAFVTLKEGAAATDAELIDHVRKQLARFKAPKRIIFGPLPKTATGKVQKKELRDRLRAA